VLEGEAASQGIRNKGLSFKIIAKDYKVRKSRSLKFANAQVA